MHTHTMDIRILIYSRVMHIHTIHTRMTPTYHVRIQKYTHDAHRNPYIHDTHAVIMQVFIIVMMRIFIMNILVRFHIVIVHVVVANIVMG
jgi:hypothetical protein